MLNDPPETREPSVSPFCDSGRALLLAAGGIALVALVAALDAATGPDLSLSPLYLLPVAVCAWWGGFSHGILISLVAAVVWGQVDWAEAAPTNPALGLWNGIVRFGTMVLIASLLSRLHLGMIREKVLARTDALTGAVNGRTFYESIAVEAERARRAGRPLTLAYLDLDHFKQLNDTFGHTTGDRALVEVARSIRANLRVSDMLARLGGDEFALLLPDTEAGRAGTLLGRVQTVIAEEMAAKGWPVTLSVGAATFVRAPVDVDVMIQHIDALMYQAKREGKNRICHEEVVPALAVPKPGERRTASRTAIERRAAVRVLLNCPARVRPEQDDGVEESGTIRNISDDGLGLFAERAYPVGTVLMIEPYAAPLQSRPLVGRVVRVSNQKAGWFHGCQLSHRLSPDDLRCWLDVELEQPPLDGLWEDEPVEA